MTRLYRLDATSRDAIASLGWHDAPGVLGCYSLSAPSKLATRLFFVCAILGLTSISYCGLHFLLKIVLTLVLLGYLFYLSKRYRRPLLNEKEWGQPLLGSSWVLVFSNQIIFVDQLPTNQWRALVFKRQLGQG